MAEGGGQCAARGAGWPSRRVAGEIAGLERGGRQQHDKHGAGNCRPAMRLDVKILSALTASRRTGKQEASVRPGPLQRPLACQVRRFVWGER